MGDPLQQQQLLDALLAADHHQQQQQQQPIMSSPSSAVATGMGGAPLVPTQDWLDQLMLDAIGPAETTAAASSSVDHPVRDPTRTDVAHILPSTQAAQQATSYSTLSALQREHNQIDPRFYSSNFNLSPEALQQQQQQTRNASTTTTTSPSSSSSAVAAATPPTNPPLGRGDEQLMSYFFDPADFNDMYEQALVSLQQSSPSSTTSGSGSGSGSGAGEQQQFTPPALNHSAAQQPGGQQQQRQAISLPDQGPSTQQLVDQLSHWYASTSRTETRRFDGAPGTTTPVAAAQIYHQPPQQHAAMHQHQQNQIGLEQWRQQQQQPMHAASAAGAQQQQQQANQYAPAYPQQQPMAIPQGHGYGGPSPVPHQPPGWITATGNNGASSAAGAGGAGGAIGKRKAHNYETPPALPGARTVPAQVFDQRQQEQLRGGSGGKSSRTVVELSPSCMGGCGKRDKMAVLLFHNSDSLAQVARDWQVKAYCEQCSLEKGLMRPPAGQLSDPTSAAASAAAAAAATVGAGEENSVDALPPTALTSVMTRPGDGCRRCDLCKRRIGSIEILHSSTNPHEGPSPTEILCTICDGRYAFCTQCGGGNRYWTGKWRPRALFPPGRKTCRLRSIRLCGTPRIEVYDVGVQGETIPDDVLNGCRVTFENKFLFRFAKPMFMSDEVDLQRLEQIMQRWWSWIHARLTEPKSALPKDLNRLLTCLRGQITAVGKGKATEEAVISYQVMEWTPEQRAVELVNSCMALTGIVSMRHLANAGKSGIYRILLKAHEQDDEKGLPREPYSSAEKRLPWPEKLVRLETDMEWERIHHFLNAGWKESARLPLEMASEWSKHQWQHRMEETLAEIDGGNNKRKTLVTLEWKFDMAMAVPPECSVLQRVGTAKTTFRPFAPGEKLKFPAYPLVRYVGDYWDKYTIDPEFHRP